MKSWLTAVAAAPILVACASAGAQNANVETEERRVLMVNGERIVLSEGENAGQAIQMRLAGHPEGQRVVMAFADNEREGWSDEQREAFEEAMEILGEAFGSEFSSAFGTEFEGEFDFHFDFDFDHDGHAVFLNGTDGMSWFGEDGENVEIHVRRIEREMEHHADQLERQAERMAERMERNAERMAIRIERHAAHAEVQGLEAGVRGVETGISSIERILERGWYEDDGERVELTEDKRAELEDTIENLIETRAELREAVAEARARGGHDGRSVRIERHNGVARAWVNGEEVTGSELDRLLELEGAPEAPEPPEPPQAPGEDED